MPETIDRGAAAARIRAARGWANLSQRQLAESLGLSLATLKRSELGHRSLAVAELLAIADVCDVPPDFMLRGFRSPEGSPPKSRRRPSSGKDEIVRELTQTIHEAMEGLLMELRRHDELTTNDDDNKTRRSPGRNPRKERAR